MSMSSLKTGNFVRVTLDYRDVPQRTGVILYVHPCDGFEENLIKIIQVVGGTYVFFSSEILRVELLSEYKPEENT